MKCIIVLVLALSLAACGVYGDKYDGLIVVDGNGTKYRLKHRIADVYFVEDLTVKDENTAVNQANTKLLGKGS